MGKKTSPLRIAVIGLQGAAPLLIQAIQNYPGAELVAIADEDGSLVSQAELNGNIERTTDMKGIVARKDIQALELNLPPKMQADIAFNALATGKHLSLHLPVAPSATIGRKLRMAALKARRTLRPNCPYVYFEPIEKAQELLQQKMLGDLQNLRIKACLGQKGGWRSGNKPLADFPPVFDRFDRRHEILPLALMSGRIESVFAHPGNGADLFQWRYSSGCIFGVFEGQIAPELAIRSECDPIDEVAEYAGTDGYLFIDRISGHMRNRPPLSFCVNDTCTQVAGDLQDNFSTAYDASIADFCQSIKVLHRPKVGMGFGINHIKFLHALKMSQQQGREVSLDEAHETD